MLIDFFIRRPVFSIVCSLIITLAGVLVIPGLPIEQYPDLASPTVTVNAVYIGASAEVVEQAVTIPLEQELNGVEGMRYLSSSSGNDGSSRITITFEPTRDPEIAAVDVQNRVARAAARLPSQVNQTGIVINKASTQLLLSVGLYTDDNRYDAEFLSNYADVVLRDPLKRVKGVGEVRIFGERKFAMRLWLDPTELARRGLTGQDVARALQEQNIQVAAGQVGQMPSPADQPYQIAVRAHGRLVEPSEFEDIVIQRGADGTLVRVSDVGRAEIGSESYGNLLRFNGRTGVGLGIFQLPTANALDVRDGVMKEIERLSSLFPPGMTYEPGTDATLAVRASINEVLKTLLAAVFLVILVIFLFLHGWRAVLLTALTLPVSLLGTFTFVQVLGFSINTLTLFGITLATGLVVDDAIVVIENIERLMAERGMSAREAAFAGMREITGAVIAITLALVAVFVPVAFFPGTTGEIYRQFALTIAVSMSISAFCALTLTPALSAALLKHTPQEEKWWFFRWIDGVVDAFRDGYGKLLGRLLKHPLLLTLIFALLFAGTMYLFRTAPTGFIPAEDQGYFIVSIQGPEGMSLPMLEEVMKEVEQVLWSQPEVSATFAVGGFSFGGNGPNHSMIFTNITGWDERPNPEQSVASIVQRIRAPLAAIGAARVVPFQPPAIRGVGSIGGFQYMVQDVSGMRSLDELAEATKSLVQAANADPRLAGIFSGFNASTPLLEVEVNRQMAKSLGIPMDQIFGTLQLFMGSQYVNDFTYASRTYRVYLQAEEQYRMTPSDLTSFYVRSDSGEMIPLEMLVTVTPTTSAQIISRYNLFRSAEINGQGAPGVSSGEALKAMEEVAQATLPPGVSGEWSGISLEQKESGGKTVMIFALGLLFVFLVLAAQYESWSLPAVVLLSVPLAMLGGLGLQLMRGLVNDVFCQVGLVMLVGLASKNAILIVEFAEQLRRTGLSAAEAVRQASMIRLRPILMTSFAFLSGVMPLMFATGAGAASRNSLGTTVFGGMLFSTFVNLIFTPGLYLVVQILRGTSKAQAPEGPEGGEGSGEVEPAI